MVSYVPLFQASPKGSSLSIRRPNRQWRRQPWSASQFVTQASPPAIVARRKSMRSLSRRLRLPPEATSQRSSITLGRRRDVASPRRCRASLPHRSNGRHALQSVARSEVPVSGRFRQQLDVGVTQTKRQNPRIFVPIFDADGQSWVDIFLRDQVI